MQKAKGNKLTYEQELKRQSEEQQEKMSKRLQQLERETAEMEVQLHRKRDEAEVKERAEGLGRAFRENFSLRLEQMRVSAQQHRQTVLEAVQLSSSLFGSGFNDFLNDRERMGASVSLFAAAAIGIYGTPCDQPFQRGPRR